MIFTSNFIDKFLVEFVYFFEIFLAFFLCDFDIFLCLFVECEEFFGLLLESFGLFAALTVGVKNSVDSSLLFAFCSAEFLVHVCLV